MAHLALAFLTFHLVDGVHILKLVEGQQPAAVVHAAADCGQGYPLAFAHFMLTNQLNQRGGDAASYRTTI